MNPSEVKMPVNKLTPKNPTEFPERKLSLVTQKDYNLSRQKGLLLFVHLNPRELSFALMTATKLEIEACKNTGVGCHFLLQVIFLAQGSNPCILH